MSGFVIGMSVSVMTARRSRPFMLWMPTATIVPITVAMSVESTAMMREFPSSASSVRSRNRFTYCPSVKPLKLAMSVPELNDATPSTIMGM